MARIDPDLARRLCAARVLLAAAEPAIPVEEIARRVAVSPFHFIRRFDQVFGSTPNRYRARLRIERAKELLATGELSVTETCFAVGFESLGSFSASFKRAVGATPSQYRREKRLLVHVPSSMPTALFPGCLSLMAGLPTGAFRNSGEARHRRGLHTPGISQPRRTR